MAQRTRRKRPATERFWAKVDKNGPFPSLHPELGRCWIWTASGGRGYGLFWVEGRSVSAHRWAYEQVNGPVPAMEDGSRRPLDHFACDQTACVRPDHLRPVSTWENNLRSDCLSALNKAKTCCPQGHPYDERNTFMRRSGRRECRQCMRQRARRQYWAARR